ncbi:MAG: YkgJ family cysteine cluster protein [Fibrobacterales bacterium]
MGGTKIYVILPYMDFLQYTFAGHLRNIRLKLTGKKLLVQGSCHMCGKCCQKINLQTGFSWLKSVKKFRKLRLNDSRYYRLKIVDRTEDGLLTFSCKSMVNGLCTTYDTRWNFCKTYPEPEVFMMGGILQQECGYSLVEAKPFEKEFKKHTNRAIDPSKVSRNAYGDIVLPQKDQ